MSIEKLIAENTAAVVALTAALSGALNLQPGAQKLTFAPVEEAAEEQKTQAPKASEKAPKAPKASAKASEPPAPKVDYVKEMAAMVMDLAAMGAEQRAAAVKVLAKHGAKRVKELKPEAYAAAHKELAALHAKFSKASDVDDDDDLVDETDDLDSFDDDEDADDLDDLED